MQQSQQEKQLLDQLIQAFRNGDTGTCVICTESLASSGVFIPYATNPLFENIMKHYTRMSFLLMCMDAYTSEYEVRLACEQGIYAEDYRDYLIEQAWHEVSWVNSMQRIHQHSYEAFMSLREHSELTYNRISRGDLMGGLVEPLYSRKIQSLHQSVQQMLGSVLEEAVYPYLSVMAQELEWHL